MRSLIPRHTVISSFCLSNQWPAQSTSFSSSSRKTWLRPLRHIGVMLAHPTRSEPVFGQRCSSTPCLSLLQNGSVVERSGRHLWVLGPSTVGSHCPEGTLESRLGHGGTEDWHLPAVCCYLYYAGHPKCLFPISIAAISF